ncbi:MAG: PHP domain-containing protein [Spirochaetota bacterium]
MKDILQQLNAQYRFQRLSAAGKAAVRLRGKAPAADSREGEVNNHVHTFYSFSPYSPSLAAYKAKEAGLKAVGIMDHDSIAGAEEMIAACMALDIASTAGFELRVNISGTAVAGKKLNNPDSRNIIYIAIHGIPGKRFKEVRAFLKPMLVERNKRNRLMVAKLNLLLESYGMEKIDFKKDVYGISKAGEGGTITERHILYAFAIKILKKAGKGKTLVEFLDKTLHVSLPKKITEYLLDERNPHYTYDLLGVLKSSFLEKIFVQPDYRECISVYETVNFANFIDAIPAYAYLGDVTDSPTGDKKAEKFEDDFLDALIPELKTIGFKAVTYMPPRNTLEQLRRIQRLCSEYELMEISGVDINSSRQTFHCPIIMEPDFRHLVDATWALIAHEKLTNVDSRYSFFGSTNPLKEKTIKERIQLYSEIGKKIDNRNPYNLRGLIPF